MAQTLLEQQTQLVSETGLANCHVLEPYNVMLNLTDITYSQKGHNKFYNIQMLQQDDDKFYIWTKWGLVGVKNPSSNLAPCLSKKEAIMVFKKKFKAKTKNNFDQIHNFVKHPGKYQIVDVKSQSRHVQDTVRTENKRR